MSDDWGRKKKRCVMLKEEKREINPMPEVLDVIDDVDWESSC
jgi:hypothetical protein